MFLIAKSAFYAGGLNILKIEVNFESQKNCRAINSREMFIEQADQKKAVAGRNV